MKLKLFQNIPKLKKMSVDKFEKELSLLDADVAVFDEIKEFAKLSIKKDIVFGCAIREGHKIFNSAVYCSGGEILHVHHKNILPNYGLFQEARFFFEGESIDSFETSYGSVMMLICEEMFWAKVIEKIATIKPTLVIILANSPARGFEDDKLLIEEQWDSLLKASAILSGSHVAFVNRVGFEDGLGFWGGSRFINPKGEVVSKAALFEKEVLEVKLDNQMSKIQKYLIRIK